VADDAVFLEEMVEDHAYAQILDAIEVVGDGRGALGAIAARDFGRDGFAIGDHPIEEAARSVPARNMALDGADVLAERIAGGFAGLGHEVGDVNASGFGVRNGVGNLRDEEIGNDAGVERARAEKDQIGFLDGFEGFGKRANITGRERELADGNAAGGDAGFAVNDAATFERGDEMDVGNRGRKDAPANGEDLAADAHGFGEISGNMSERGEKKIAEIMAAQAAASLKAILKEASEEGFVLGQGDHAIANIAGRKDAVFAAQPAGAAAVIGYGDDGGEIGDGALFGGMLVTAADDVLLEPAKEGGKAGAAAESDDAEAAGRRLRFLGTFIQDWPDIRFAVFILQDRFQRGDRRVHSVHRAEVVCVFHKNCRLERWAAW
jgi:hypothetical protein